MLARRYVCMYVRMSFHVGLSGWLSVIVFFCLSGCMSLRLCIFTISM